MPYFSIIVPVYNVAPYLREALDSVLAQTFADWECLCVDDGSTDGSGAILDEYAAKDSRFRVFHKENGGVSSARNLALDNAKGGWFWFVDADDMIHPQALDVLEKIVRENSCVEAVSFRATCEKWGDLQYQGTVIAVEHSYESLWRFTVSASFVLYRHDKIGNLQFQNYCVGEDGLFSMKYFLALSQWVETDMKLYFYRSREGSAMHSMPSEKFVRDWILMLTERTELLSSRPGGGVCCCYLSSIQPMAWYTHDFGLFRLPFAQRRQLMPLWLHLVGAINARVAFSLPKRVIYQILRLTRSPILLNLLVYRLAQLRIFLGRLKRVLLVRK